MDVWNTAADRGLTQTPNWKAQKKKELQTRIESLAEKIIFVTGEVKRFAPRKARRGSYNLSLHGMIRHWHKMAKQSLMATRKKIYRLKDEMGKL